MKIVFKPENRTRDNIIAAVIGAVIGQIVAIIYICSNS